MYLIENGELRSALRKEAVFSEGIARGNRGRTVKRVQEWLCLHDMAVVVDGAFGPVTARAISEFQSLRSLPETGGVDRETFLELVRPLRRSLSNPLQMSIPFGEAVCAFAASHLAEHPREVGGDNRGPWVRLYMDGREGPAQFWCAGFVRLLLRQAAEALNIRMPIAGSVSCDTLARQGREAGLFLSERQATPDRISPGSIFLNRRTSTDWTHTGIVIDARDDHFVAIEGNTNDEGSRNGYEVCTRRRSYRKRDFIVFD